MHTCADQLLMEGGTPRGGGVFRRVSGGSMPRQAALLPTMLRAARHAAAAVTSARRAPRTLPLVPLRIVFGDVGFSQSAAGHGYRVCKSGE